MVPLLLKPDADCSLAPASDLPLVSASRIYIGIEHSPLPPGSSEPLKMNTVGLDCILESIWQQPCKFLPKREDTAFL